MAAGETDGFGIQTPQLIAHRGYAAKFPENTRESLAAAVDVGAQFVEFDIQLTRDRVPVLLHDDNFSRTGGPKRSVFKTDAVEATTIEVNEPEKFGTQFSGVTVPLLEDVVSDLAGWPGVTAFVELKHQSLAKFGAQQMLIRVLEVLQPVIDRSVMISFNHDAVLEARRQSGIAVGWVLRKYNAESRALAKASAPEFLFCRADRLPANGATVWPGDWLWVCYGVSERDQALELAARGIGMISTFEIGNLLKSLQ